MVIVFTKDVPTEGGLYLRRDPERAWNDPVLLKVTKAREGRCWAHWGTGPRDVLGIGGEWAGPLIEGEPLAPSPSQDRSAAEVMEAMRYPSNVWPNYSVATAAGPEAGQEQVNLDTAGDAQPAAVGEPCGSEGSQSEPVCGDPVSPPAGPGEPKPGTAGEAPPPAAGETSCPAGSQEGAGDAAVAALKDFRQRAAQLAWDMQMGPQGGQGSSAIGNAIQDLPLPTIAAPLQPIVLPSREELAKVMYERRRKHRVFDTNWSEAGRQVREFYLDVADAVLARLAERGGEQKKQPIVYYGVPMQVCEAAHAELESATSIEAIRARVLLKAAIETAARRKDRGAPQPVVYGVPWEVCERLATAVEQRTHTFNARGGNIFEVLIPEEDAVAFLSAYEAARRNPTENPLAKRLEQLKEHLAEANAKNESLAGMLQRQRRRTKTAWKIHTEARETAGVKSGMDLTGWIKDVRQQLASVVAERDRLKHSLELIDHAHKETAQQLTEARAAKEAAEAGAAEMRECMSRIIFSEAWRGEMFFIHGWQKTPETVANALSKDDHEKWVAALAGTAGRSLLSELTSLRAKLAEAERENKGHRRRHDWDLVKQDIEELSSLKARAAQLEAVLRKVETTMRRVMEATKHADSIVYRIAQSGLDELAAALRGDGATSHPGSSTAESE